MKTIFTSIILSFLSFTMVLGQNDIQFNAGGNWLGYMNVFNLDGTYNFGSGWEVAKLKSTPDVSANTLTLRPNFNTYEENSGDEFWVNQTTGEGAKTMEALTFVEPGASFNGQDFTFSGAVESSTLDAGYTAKYFVKALDPEADYSDALGGSGIFDLPTSGNFSVTIPGSSLPEGLLIQYGFSITGTNANPANEAALGSIVIGAGSVSVSDLNRLKAEVSIYPNPVSEMLYIKTDVDVQSYEISSLLGQTILKGNATNSVDVSQLGTGTYIITVRSEEGSNLMKFIKN